MSSSSTSSSSSGSSSSKVCNILRVGEEVDKLPVLLARSYKHDSSRGSVLLPLQSGSGTASSSIEEPRVIYVNDAEANAEFGWVASECALAQSWHISILLSLSLSHTRTHAHTHSRALPLFPVPLFPFCLPVSVSVSLSCTPLPLHTLTVASCVSDEKEGGAALSAMRLPINCTVSPRSLTSSE